MINYAPEIEDQRADFFFNEKCTFYLNKKNIITVVVFIFQRLIFNSVTNCLGPRKLLYHGTMYKVTTN